MRDLLWGCACLLVGILLVLAASGGWLGGPASAPATIALAAAILAYLAGTVFFIRYLIKVVKEIRERR